MDASAVRKFVIHPTEFPPFEFEVVEFYTLLNVQAEIALQYLYCKKQGVYLKRHQDKTHEQRKS
jgi:hypothetical protein